MSRLRFGCPPASALGNPDGGQWTDGGGGGSFGSRSSGVLVGGTGKDKLANPRVHIGGNGPPPESGTLLGRVGAVVGRYVFGPLGALISMTEEMGNGELVGPYSGGKTEGVLESAEGDYYLRSGWAGPASQFGGKGTGFDIVTRTHVEGHAAALMRQLGLKEARVYVNNPDICVSCRTLLPRMLPPGARLEVVTPRGAQTFVGGGMP